MKRYSVSVPYFCSIMVEVEAKNKKQAIQVAFDNMDTQVCVHCSKHIEMGEHDADNEPAVYEIID